MKAFLYARVSTRDKEQDPGPQLAEMRQYGEKRNWKLTEFVDQKSAGKKRPEFERMLSLARKGKCDVVVCRHFDRIGRSVLELVGLMEEFRTRNIDFVSLNENIDTTTPAGKAMFQMIAVFAEFEREMIRDRVRLGMADAKERLDQGLPTRKGKTRWAGRPRVVADVAQLRALRRQGLSFAEIAAETGVSKGSVFRLCKGHPKAPAAHGKKP